MTTTKCPSYGLSPLVASVLADVGSDNFLGQQPLALFGVASRADRSSNAIRVVTGAEHHTAHTHTHNLRPIGLRTELSLVRCSV